MGRMAVNQGLQPGKKLTVGDFIGGCLSFSFRLRSRRAVVLPGHRVSSLERPRDPAVLADPPEVDRQEDGRDRAELPQQADQDVDDVGKGWLAI